MRKVAIQWVLFSVIALILFCIVPFDMMGQADGAAPGVPDSQQTAKQSHGVAQSNASHHDTGGLAFRANLAPSTNYQFFNFRQVQPSWGRIRFVKIVSPETGFFFPIMVLLFFSRFYQRARAVSGSDSDGAAPALAALVW